MFVVTLELVIPLPLSFEHCCREKAFVLASFLPLPCNIASSNAHSWVDSLIPILIAEVQTHRKLLTRDECGGRAAPTLQVGTTEYAG